MPKPPSSSNTCWVTGTRPCTSEWLPDELLLRMVRTGDPVVAGYGSTLRNFVQRLNRYGNARAIAQAARISRNNLRNNDSFKRLWRRVLTVRGERKPGALRTKHVAHHFRSDLDVVAIQRSFSKCPLVELLKILGKAKDRTDAADQIIGFQFRVSSSGSSSVSRLRRLWAGLNTLDSPPAN